MQGSATMDFDRYLDREIERHTRECECGAEEPEDCVCSENRITARDRRVMRQNPDFDF